MVKLFDELKQEMSPQRRERIVNRVQAILNTLAQQELRQSDQFSQQEMKARNDSHASGTASTGN
jgi:hypothetical protein